MPKDYAKKMISARRRQHQKERSVLHAALAMIVALGLIIVAVYAFHAYRQSRFFSNEHVAGWVTRATAMVSRKDKTAAKTGKLQVTSPADDIQFDFYTELPNVQVNLPETTELKPAPATAAAPATTTAPRKQAVQYVVLVGEFKDPVSASQLRLSLLLAGVPTDIVKTPEHTFRVQQGPWPSQKQAKSAQRQLSKKGFEGSIRTS
ncbi:MAG TPA: SPOR domain-containing protein [Gammaproteobacteria bacterium]|nr:SPOR domain-containing protein [Gammaproteobacteria bacterium]